MGKFLKKLFIITFAMIFVSAGIYYLWIPLNLAPGGTTGLTVIIKSFFPGLSVSLALGCINIFLLLCGFIFIGKEFGGWTIYSSIVLSGIIKLF